MMAQIKARWLFALAAFISLSVVFNEFLQVYSFADRRPALIMTGILCLALFVIPKGWLRIPVIILIFLVGVYRYFSMAQSFGWNWLQLLRSEGWQLLVRGFAGELWPTPTLLAYLLIWSALVLLADLMVVHRQIWFPYVALIVYLLVLSVFNAIDPVWQLLLLGSLMLAAFGVRNNHFSWGRSSLALLLAAALGAGAYFLPESWFREPVVLQTADLREKLNQQGLYQFIYEAGQGSRGRTGFGEDDSQLGGALTDDDTLLFTAIQDKSHYWWVDSKEHYTGQGWERSEKAVYSRIEGDRLNLAGGDFYQKEKQETHINFNRPIEYLPRPYGESQIALVAGYEGFHYFSVNDRVDLIPAGSQDRQVQISWVEPDFTVEELQSQPQTGGLDNIQEYLQLPESLPQRVRELANEITKDEVDYYRKVKAVESYFSGSGEFRYSKVDAAISAPDRDYVDQFLFDTKVGYCDNFSTSMVVLLRSVGIPARWAKGFSNGDVVPGEGDQKIWQVRNKHAHSWPEVYFEGFGWVPFEPTPAFVNPDVPRTFAQTQASDEPQQPTTEPSDETAPTAESTTPSSAISTSESQESTVGGQELTGEVRKESQLLNFMKERWLWLLLAVMVIALVLLWRYWFRFQVSLNLWLAKDPLIKAYPVILKRCEKLLPRGAEESLGHYAAGFEEKFPEAGADFRRLTATYESRLYGGEEMAKAEKAQLQQTVAEIAKLKRSKYPPSES